MVGSLLSNLFGRRYTIGELMAIDQGRQGRASACSVNLVSSWVTLKEEGVAQKFKALFNKTSVKMCYVTLKLAVKSDTGNSHNVFIQLEPDFQMAGWAGNKVRIYCDCKDFMYRSAYLLTKRDSLFVNDRVKIALGQALTDAPDGKRGLTLLCKHSYAALQWLMNNYQTVMNTL